MSPRPGQGVQAATLVPWWCQDALCQVPTLAEVAEAWSKAVAPGWANSPCACHCRVLVGRTSFIRWLSLLIFCAIKWQWCAECLEVSHRKLKNLNWIFHSLCREEKGGSERLQQNGEHTCTACHQELLQNILKKLLRNRILPTGTQCLTLQQWACVCVCVCEWRIPNCWARPTPGVQNSIQVFLMRMAGTQVCEMCPAAKLCTSRKLPPAGKYNWDLVPGSPTWLMDFPGGVSTSGAGACPWCCSVMYGQKWSSCWVSGSSCRDSGSNCTVALEEVLCCYQGSAGRANSTRCWAMPDDLTFSIHK